MDIIYIQGGWRGEYRVIPLTEATKVQDDNKMSPHIRRVKEVVFFSPAKFPLQRDPGTSHTLDGPVTQTAATPAGPEDEAPAPPIVDDTAEAPPLPPKEDEPVVPLHDRPWPATAEVIPPDARTIEEVTGEMFAGKYVRRSPTTRRPIGIAPEVWNAFGQAKRDRYAKEFAKKYSPSPAFEGGFAGYTCRP